jgi:hypothetical protein
MSEQLIIVANRLLFNPAGEGPARTWAVQG